MSDPDIICERRGSAGTVLLNRPKALNAITLDMVRILAEALNAWETDPAVTRVVVSGAGEKAFCAGGDIRMLYEAGRSGDLTPSLAFWREEFRLNTHIKRYPKPYVSLIDGMVMGGGVGISLHGSQRVAGDRYRFAMPEVGIGFVPDVGATYALPRLAGELGTYLALTGASVGPDDAVALGLATHRVASADFPALDDALIAGEPVEAALERVARPPGAARLLEERELIDRCFSAGDVEEILARLDAAAAEGSEFAAKTAATMRAKAPSSLAIAREQMRRGGAMSFEEAMANEFRIVTRLAEEHDFYEGVRATIVDKDGAPRWRPASLAELPRGFAAAHFEPRPGRELEDAP